jgi:hypothetical protein
MDVVNSGFRWKQQHLYLYDEQTLRALLEEVGFEAIERKAFGESEVADFRGRDLPSRQAETLYMEARAPQGSAP